MRKNKTSILAHVRFCVFTVMNMQKKKKKGANYKVGSRQMDYLASIMWFTNTESYFGLHVQISLTEEQVLYLQKCISACSRQRF